MSPFVADIWRHPLKSHGREAVDAVVLRAGKTMQGDRVWAVAHEASRFQPDDPKWVECRNFSRGAQNPALMAIDSRLNDESGMLKLSHPDLGDILFDPDQADDVERFVDWVRPLNLPARPAPEKIVRVPGRGMTDTAFPSISILSHASLGALSRKSGQEVSPLRWRGNIWLGGMRAWEEFDWIGHEVRIGSVRFIIREAIGRCLATSANPETGVRDIQTLALLKEGWGHTDFGVYGEVIEGGKLATGDEVVVEKRSR